jgi:glycosyltransferase involved in cell wall biosynthesis
VDADQLVSVVLPAYNEEALLATTVREVVGGLRSRACPFEVIVVENGSVDGTRRVAIGLAEEFDEVQATSLPAPDYGAALRAGFLAARGDVVVNFDVDHVDLAFLDRALELMRHESGPVIVVGSKRAPGADDTRPPHRRLVTAGFSFVLRRGFGLRVSDTHGMKALAREVLVPVVNRCRLGTDLFDTELILRAERLGMLAAEIPVVVEERRPPRSSILRRGVRTLGGLVRLRGALRD